MSRLLFADESVDRREAVRTDPAALDGLMRGSESRFLRLRRGRVRVAANSPLALAWEGWGDVSDLAEEGAEYVFLGMAEGSACFAVIPAELPQTAEDRPRDIKPEADYIGLFQAASVLAPAEGQLAAQAMHLANWINRSRHCGRCGFRMRAAEGGHKRDCTNPACGWHEFPRTDPVVLALVFRGERCVLGRQARMPPGFYAPLAGFVAPAESVEAAVRREVLEEVGLHVGNVTYVDSQPWPFPTSLMMGFLAEALDEELAPNPAEIQAARWFDRAEVAELARVDIASAAGRMHLPPPGVVGRRVIDLWALGPGQATHGE